ncbi:IS3 family transposase [Mycoplasmatota bacterium WC44]
MQIHRKYNKRLSKKTIYRYMKINGIKSIIRKKRNKYGKKEHHNIPNLIKRDFVCSRPNQKWSIDISYIHTIQGVEYLCAIKDMYDKSIIEYQSSPRMSNFLVVETVEKAIKKVKLSKRENLILHSDQGAQFTSTDYSKLLRENHIRHSVSAKGNCADNVPIESWFSALKSECIYLIKKVPRERIRELIRQYVDYYNNERLQEQLKELTPMEYRKLAHI